MTRTREAVAVSSEGSSLPAAGSRLRDAWEANAAAFIAWARSPGLDSYWRFHRDQFLRLVPPPGRLTLDIGCGEGRLSRDLTRLGHNVVGVDASPTMVAHAREADPSIDVHLADAADIPFPTDFADLAVAFMSLQDIDDLASAVDEIGRVLQPGGRVCLAIVHPLNSAGRFLDDDPASPFVIDGSYLEPSFYEDVVERAGHRVTFPSIHRPLQSYVDALADAGFLVERMREPAVPEAAVLEPRSLRWRRLPLFLHLRAIRTGHGAASGVPEG